MIGYAMCGSYCTVAASLCQMRILRERGFEVLPVISESLAGADTRFTNAKELLCEVEKICSREPVTTISGAEPLGPRLPLDALVVAPCTGNTAAKLACGITDTCVTMAAKAHLRNNRPLLIALASNDALSVGLANIGQLMLRKNVYFVPLSQDMPDKKPNSLICDYTLLPEALESALAGRQLQPMLLSPEARVSDANIRLKPNRSLSACQGAV